MVYFRWSYRSTVLTSSDFTFARNLWDGLAFLQASLFSWLLHWSSQTHHLLMCENSKFFYCILWLICIKSTFSSIFCCFWHFPHFIHSTDTTSKSITRDFPGGAVSKSTLPVQGVRVQSLVREDPICRVAKKKKSLCTWTENFQMFKLDLEKAEEPKIKLPTSLGNRKSKRIPKKHLLLLHWLRQSLWLCGSQQTVENSETDGNNRPPYLPPEKSVRRSRSNS